MIYIDIFARNLEKLRTLINDIGSTEDMYPDWLNIKKGSNYYDK